MRELKGELVDADGVERLRGEREDLCVCPRSGLANEFDPRLLDLLLSAGPPAPPTKDAAFISEAIRTGALAHRRRRDAGNLRRDIGPKERDLAALRLDKA